MDTKQERDEAEAEEERRAITQMMMQRQSVTRGAPAVATPNEEPVTSKPTGKKLILE